MRSSFRSIHVLWLGVLLAVLTPWRQADAGQPARYLGKEDILLYGIGLQVEPAQQTVPKDIATIVSTYLKARTEASGLPPFAPDAEVRATLAGPSFSSPRELVVRPNMPFHIPALSVPGVHTLENIRLVSNGEVLMYGAPQSVRIEVIERLLVTQITARPLTAAEIREAGIAYDRNSFQAYNFAAAFAIEDRKINLNFPVLLPTLQGAADQQNQQATLQAIAGAQLPTLRTIIPDTLKIQTQVPNLSVVGFTLKAPSLQGQNLVVPPIPGVIVIPGDIGFLNQFFSVMLMVGNVAPAGSNLVVSQLQAEIVLPPDANGVTGSGKEPLVMARTANGVTQKIADVVQPGLDAKLGTADDITTIGPGETGNAEYLVEGRREGTHVVEMKISGVLNGLPVGPVPINGRAAGSVLVRNPKFALTFTHPEVVSAGEPYRLDVTVSNTSASPANLVTLNFYPGNVSGATIEGASSRQIESIAPGDSATVSFNLVSRVTGKVTAATLDSDENVAGRFALKTAVGELGAPLSPDSLVLPKEAASLPPALRDATIGLLGKAWAVATAPPAAIPPGLSPFSRKIVIDRAVEAAEAGLRVTLGEPVAVSAAQLAMDFMGSNYARLSSLVKPADLEFERKIFEGFDELRRKSIRGDVFATAIANELAATLASAGSATAFHDKLAQDWSYRPGHVSVLVAGAGGALSPYELAIIDAQGRRVGGTVNGKIVKEIPFSDLLPFTAAAGGIATELAVLAAPEAGALKVRLTPRAGVAPGTPAVLSIVLPDGANGLRHVVYQLDANQAPAPLSLPGAPNTFTFEVGGAASQVDPLTNALVVDPAPTVISVIQQADADQIRCDPEKPGFRAGRIVAVLFSEEVTPQSVQDRRLPHEITNYLPAGNAVVGVALQPGRRIAFLALRDPLGPIVPRSITLSNIEDPRGHVMAPWTGPMTTTIVSDGATVSGRVLDAFGKPMPFADVRLFYQVDCGGGAEPRWVGISAKQADEHGGYSWDYVARPLLNRILAVDTQTNEIRNVQYNVQREGQHLNVDIVFLGRGSIQGTVRSEQGVALFDTVVRVTSLTDQSQYSARSDANGRYAIARVPVGNIFIEAVNQAAKAEIAQADYIPSAGSVVHRDLTLLDVEQRKVKVAHGTIHGHVYRADGVTPAGGLPVFVYYRTNSQQGVACPPGTSPCPIARATTTADGKFSFVDVTAGELTLTSFDQTGLSMAQVGLVLAANGTASANLLLSGGVGTVKGQVLTADNKAVKDAKVGGGLSLTTTDDYGKFTLTDVPVGRREIVAVSTELGATGKSTIDIVVPGEVVSTTIMFPAQGSVAGTVTQANGTPVSGVTVYVFRRSPSGGGYDIVGQAPTSEQGTYQINRVPEGSYQVSAFNAGFTDGNVTPVVVKFNGQVARADIKFRGGAGKIIGKVLNDVGNTPLKARVGVSGDRVRVAGGLVGVGFERVENFAIADSNLENGEFTLTGILVGSFTLNAVGQFSPDPISRDGSIPSPGATVNVELRLKATSQIRGVVTNPNGTPVGAGVVVRYKSESYKLVCTEDASGEEQCDSLPQGIQEENVTTDTDGRFWVPVVNAGSFSLSVDDVQRGKALTKGSVRPGETAEVPVRLLAQASVKVRVRGSDTTSVIPGAKVVVWQPAFPKIRRELTAGDDGVADFTGGDNLAEGDYVVEATDQRPNGFGAGRASGRIAGDGADVVTDVYLFDQTGTVHGIIYNADGFTPVANADVVVANGAGPLAFAVSGTDGTYSVGTIPLGDVRVEIFDAKSGRRGSGSGHVSFDDQNVPINVVLSPIGVVKGIVLDGTTRAPLKGWTVTLQQRSALGVMLPVLTSTTGVDGRFLIPGAAKGSFLLRAVKKDENGIGQGSGSLEQEGQVVDVPMLVTIARPLSGSITGTVLGVGGVPAADTNVVVTAQGRPPVPLVTNEYGVFSLQDVPLGRFTVRARKQGSHDAGSAIGEVRTDGEVAAVVVAMEGVAQVSGTVERADGSPVVDAEVVFEGFPGTACDGPCTRGTDSQGRFSFVDQPARRFTVTATESGSQLTGTAGGPLTAGQNLTGVRIVLAPTAALSGRVLRAAGQPASGIVAELIVRENTATERRLYKQTQADGTFVFPTAPLEPYRLVLEDPVGSGSASRSGQLTGAISLGDIVLDEAAPSVASLTPQASATGVPVDQKVTIVFTEPIQPGTVNNEHIKLLRPDQSEVLTTFEVTTNDTKVVVKPHAELTVETRYTLRVTGIEDRVGKVMAADYTAEFTTVDEAAPTVADASPKANDNGVPIATPIRIRFSEPFVPAKFTAPVFTLTGPNGVVPGELVYRFGNTVMIFTPNAPLAVNTTYQVAIAAAEDVAGNKQPAGTSYQFSTTDTTKPQIADLDPSNNGKVIENGLSTVTAELPTTHDVAFIDFYLNGSLAFVDRASPFAITFQATPQLGAPGSTIAVSAVATDTSGNRGDAISEGVLILPDQAPTVAITSPAAISAKNGDHIVVTVRATDDLGVKTIAYRAQTGNAADAATRTLPPATLDRTEDFAFIVPANAVPGSVIAIEASAVDAFGHVTTATPVQVTVLDAQKPSVTITGATTGTQVQPGQQTTVVVKATDQGGVSEISLITSGVVTKEEPRPVSPPQNSVVTSFTVTVPTTAQPGQSLHLDATAKDKAGNAAAAARVTLTVADTKPPIVTLATGHDTLDAVPGETVTVIATATDETGVTQVNLSTTGAVEFSDAKQVDPPLNTAVVPFLIAVPAGATPGSTIEVQVTATDNTSHTSTPVAITLTVRSLVDVTLPASEIVDAGQTRDITVQLSAPAPAEGLTVGFTSTNTGVVTVPPSIAFAAGETSKTLTLTGVAGGTAQVQALIGGVERATMTVTVAGGIVKGIVRNAMLVPVVGANVTITSGASSFPAVTDGDGKYSVSGVAGPNVTVRVFDENTKLYGFARGQMAQTQGVVTVNVILIPAGAISGNVVDAAGENAGAGVKVEIFSGTSASPIDTTFTGDEGQFEFPLVTLGNYMLQATSGAYRGRANASLTLSGQDVDTTIAYLGAGTVNGTVRQGGVPVGNALLTFESWSIFGANTPIVTNADPDGTFSIPDVPIGTFTVTAESTGQKGSASGRITLNEQSVTANVNLASYGAVAGLVRRFKGSTTVAGAVVTLSAPNYWRQTKTNPDGEYRFDVVPLGTYSLTATEASTRSTGSATAKVDTHQATKDANITFLPQGRLLVKVQDASGDKVVSAFVRVNASIGNTAQETLTGTTGQDGRVLIDHVFAGSYSVTATSGGLGGTITGSLASDELKEVTVSLQPTGSITGTVFAPIGQVPVAGARVMVIGQGIVTTNEYGVYRIDGLVPGRYDISVSDTAGRVRAKTDVRNPADDIVIATHNQVAERHFTMIGLGTVKGRVVFASNGQSASSMPVSLSIQAPGFQSVRTMNTNPGGIYEFTNVPVGPASAVVSDTTQKLYGENSGVLAVDPGELELDISLTSNAIKLPMPIWDANNKQFDVQPGGQVLAGSGGLFNGDGVNNRGAFALEIVSGEAATTFDGGEVPTIEDGAREIAVRQENVFGLSITRKIFVPRAGYFARYLEILRNPTESPITVDVKVTGHVSGTGVAIDSTSSGDAILDIADEQSPDTWFVAGRSDAVGAAFVFDGAAAADRVDEVSFTPMQTGQATFARVAYRWNTITVPAGGTVALMHFGVQQFTRAAAIASAQRLASLPPEAIAGLSAEEIATIHNVAVPANGQSAIAALPALTGSVTGKALEADATTAIASASVSLHSDHPLFGGTYSKSSAADGSFTFTAVFNDSGTSVAIPVAPFTLGASYPGTEIQSPTAAGAIDPQTKIGLQNVVFDNTGGLYGNVTRHTGEAVVSGNVKIEGGTPSTSRTVSIAGDATYRAGGLPPGQYTLTATMDDPKGTGLTGVVTTTVVAGPSAPANIELQAAGTLTGLVTRSGGQPAGGITVKVVRPGFSRETTTGTGGAYTFENMPAGTFTVSAIETGSGIATSAPATIVANEPTTRNLTLVITGRVIGVVKRGTQTLRELPVSLRSHHPLVTRSLPDTTDPEGEFSFDSVPVGNFTVTVHDVANQLYGEATGTIQSEGQQVSVTVNLASNPIGLPQTRYDASNFTYNIRPGGQIGSGTNAFGSNPDEGAARLLLGNGSTLTMFAGSAMGTHEDGSREIGIRQTNIAGVTVTRKVYVPADGYFARYLEILSNPSPLPVTLQVRVRSRVGSSGHDPDCNCTRPRVPFVTATASGDDTFDAAPAAGGDNWITLAHGDDVDPFESSSVPALAFVFGGANPSIAASAGSYTTPPPFGLLEYEWQNVTVPANGGTVALMHFVVQQTSRAGALAAAERLSQLPPEALSGLSLLELATIKNFAVPPAGVSTLEPLPPLTGIVQGHTRASDQTTIVPNAPVKFRSANPLFGRRHPAPAIPSGAFTFTGSVNTSGTSIAVPVGPFTLTASHPVTNAQASANGDFEVGQTTATQDVSFTGTGTLSVLVTLKGGDPIAGASVRLEASSFTNATTNSDGRATFTGLQPRSYSLFTQRLPVSPQTGDPIDLRVPATATANQTTPVLMEFPAFGRVTGTLTVAGSGPLAGNYVTITNLATLFQRAMPTNGNGVFLLTDLPEGTYRLTSTHPTNHGVAEAQVVIVGGQTAEQDLTLPANGTVTVTVSYARGGAAAGGAVSIRHGGTNGEFRGAGTTNESGQVTIGNVPVGNFQVRAHHPKSATYWTEVAGSVDRDTGGASVPVTLPALGMVHGKLLRARGAPAPGLGVELRTANGNAFVASATANDNGNFQFNAVPIDQGLHLATVNQAYPQFKKYGPDFTLHSDNEDLEMDAWMPAVATVKVQVRKDDGNGWPDLTIQSRNITPYFSFAGYTNASGDLDVAPIGEGTFTMRVRDTNTGVLIGERSGTITKDDDTLTVPFPISITATVGTISGTVFAADSARPLSNVDVVLYDAADSKLLKSTKSAADGTYEFTGVVSGQQGLFVRAIAPNNPAILIDTPVVITTPGETVDVNVTLPVTVGSITGVVRAGAGNVPLANATVAVRDSGHAAGWIQTKTNESGVYRFTDVAFGSGFTIVAAVSGTSVEHTGAFASQGQEVTVDFSMPIIVGSVSGTVYAGDSVTALGSVMVQVRSASGDVLASGPTSQSGQYSFANVYAPGPMVAWATTFSGLSGTSEPGELAGPGESVTLDPVIHASVIKGRVTRAGGTQGVAQLSVFVETADHRVLTPHSVSRDGDYIVIGAPAGPIRVTAQDYETGIQKVASATVVDTVTPVLLDFTLPGTGTITARVFDREGGTVDGVRVDLRSESLGFERYEETSDQGVFTFTGIPEGAVWLTAALQDETTEQYTYMAGTGTAVRNSSVAIDLTPVPTGTVSGQVRLANQTPVGGASVGIQSFYGAAMFEGWATADGNGNFSLADVPSGPVYITAWRANATTLVGKANGTLAPSGTLTRPVNGGTAVNVSYALTGSDDFRYDITRGGELEAGGKMDGTASTPYVSSFTLDVNGDSFCCTNTAALGAGGRQVTLGPMLTDTLAVSRSVFVPESGGFARYLEVLYNPATIAQTVTVYVRAALRSDTRTHWVVTPESTSYRYAVSNESFNAEPTQSSLGYVMAGSGAVPAPVTAAEFKGDGSDTFGYQYTVTVGPKQKVALMHFQIQRDPTDTAGAQAAAAALSALTDPNALAGLTAEERAMIVNFVITP